MCLVAVCLVGYALGMLGMMNSMDVKQGHELTGIFSLHIALGYKSSGVNHGGTKWCFTRGRYVVVMVWEVRQQFCCWYHNKRYVSG